MSKKFDYKKMAEKNYRVKHISLFEAQYMTLLGIMDGNEKVFKNDENDGWMSPNLYKERIAYRKFETKRWLLCRSQTAEKHIAVSKLYFRIKQMENDLKEFDSKISKISINEQNLQKRFTGEEKIQDEIIYQRRYKEQMAGHIHLIQQKKELQSSLSIALRESSDIMSEILEMENMTRGICDEVKQRTYERMTKYWNGVLKRHPQHDRIPALPPLIKNSDAEKQYLEDYQSTRRYFDEIMKMKDSYLFVPFTM